MEPVATYNQLEDYEQAKPFHHEEFSKFFFRMQPVYQNDWTTVGNLIETMNKFLCISLEGGNSKIFMFTENYFPRETQWKPTSKKNLIEMMGPFSLLNLEKKKNKPKNIIEIWMEHPERCYVSAFIFDPEQAPGYIKQTQGDKKRIIFNEWTGFNPTITRVPADQIEITKLATIFFHLRMVICRDSDVLFDWMMQWLASIVQFPWKKLLVVPVIVGVQGAGKSMFFENFARIFGQHAIPDMAAALMTHKYYGSELAQKVFVCVNETSFENCQEAAAIKSQITSTVRKSEKKFQDVKIQKDFVNMVWTSQHTKHSFPAEKGTNRRYFPIEADPSRANRADYFKELKEAFDTGGLTLLYTFLRGLPAKDTVNLNFPPHTQEKSDAIMVSLDTFDNFWKKCLDAKTHHNIYPSMTFSAGAPLWVTGGANFQYIWDLFKKTIPPMKENWTELRFYQCLKEVLPDLSPGQSPSLEEAYNAGSPHFDMPAWRECKEYFYKTTGLSSTAGEIITQKKRSLEYNPEKDKRQKRDISTFFIPRT